MHLNIDNDSSPSQAAFLIHAMFLGEATLSTQAGSPPPAWMPWLDLRFGPLFLYVDAESAVTLLRCMLGNIKQWSPSWYSTTVLHVTQFCVLQAADVYRTGDYAAALLLCNVVEEELVGVTQTHRYFGMAKAIAYAARCHSAEEPLADSFTSSLDAGDVHAACRECDRMDDDGETMLRFAEFARSARDAQDRGDRREWSVPLPSSREGLDAFRRHVLGVE